MKLRGAYRIVLRLLPSLKHFVELVYSHGIEIQRLESKMNMLKAEVNSLRVEKATSYTAAFSPHSRHISKNDLKVIASKWLPRFGYENNGHELKMLGYIAHRICSLEYICIGRTAGTITTHLLRVLAARSLEGNTLDVLEVGTLFGIGAIEIYDNSLGSFDNIHLTVIDPLDNFYGEALDCYTRIPVTREILEANMKRCAIPESDYTIIQKLSHDEDAIREASQRRYDILVIDGDHTYEGVKKDYTNYRPLVKAGGYIVFDDYWANFTGIVKFVDEEVRGTPNVVLVGADADDRIAIFRAVK